MTNTNETVEKLYWRSLEALAESPEALERMHHEFPTGAFEEYLTTRSTTRGADSTADSSDDGVSRRRFLGFMSASVAAASAAMSGCIRKPAELILPYKERPEDLVPGRPNTFATAMVSGASVLGLLVESHDGRPTKIEGNPSHPLNGDAKDGHGSTDALAQAAILDLYDADRTQTPFSGDAPSTPAEWNEAFASIASAAKSSGGQGLALLMGYTPSPSLYRILGELKRALPQAKLYRHDPAYPVEAARALSALGMPGAAVLYDIDKADVVLSVASDFLGTETNATRNARLFAKRRRSDLDGAAMSRLYAAESSFTLTGMQADNRLQLKPSQVGPFLAAVAQALAAEGVTPAAGAEPMVGKLAALVSGQDFGKWPAAIAKDLAAKRSRSLVVVGERQPAAVQALGHLLNQALGNAGNTLRYVAGAEEPEMGSLADLVAAMNQGSVDTLFVLESNPVYSSPGAVGFGAAYAKVQTRVHVGFMRDETAVASTWHVPSTHFLESWGDLRAADGTMSIQQPLIAPLYPAAVSSLELVAALAGIAEPKSYDIVRQTWQGALSGNFEKAWRRALHDGIVAGQASAGATPAPDVAALAQELEPTKAGGTEVLFVLGSTVLDGRYANNPWLQELPDPVTKLTWDNAALLSPATAQALGVSGGDLLSVSANGQSLQIAAWPTPGVALDTVVLALGYGREHGGRYAKGAGVNAYPLLPLTGWSASGASIAKAGGSYPLASTQDHGTMMDRPIVREATFQDFKANPNFVESREVMPKDKIKSLSTEPARNEKYKQQWGMSIDLQACVGCNACTIACQAENSIPVVGKERVLNGREMHWIRLDRYFVGDMNNPRAVSQPLPCAHCETAPCETVCPVAATVHSPEGLNDMAYNRCIGTRYCANNCPFKVRRFNFFHFTQEMDRDIPLVRFQRNPDVTVRFRGVMEKCTYCVQRIQDARIRYKRDGEDVIPDGAVTPACAQACPTQAIVFGDIDDPNTRVSREKANPRNYVLLRELNVRPRTSYLARIQNPNPELV